VVTRQLKVERRTESVRQPKTGVPPTVLRNQPLACSVFLTIKLQAVSVCHLLLLMLMFISLCRPVAGYVNLCPESVSTKPHDIHQMHSTIKHEMLHALVSIPLISFALNFLFISTLAFIKFCTNV